MKNYLPPEMSPESIKAFDAGYRQRFVFKNGDLYCTLNPEKCYPIQTVSKQAIPCIRSKSNIYRIETPEGTKGIAIVEWVEIEQDD